jgi:predicted Zn-ribbon and HTH transcriptional regulator
MSPNTDLKKFQRNIEDFVCSECGFSVAGNGYTNHCPKCLWSRHVDINPGDRLAVCQGAMEPVSIELKGEEYVITHQCVKCGFVRKNKTTKGDNFDAILALSSA